MSLAVATPPHAWQNYPVSDSPAQPFQADLAAKGEEILENGSSVLRPLAAVRKMSSLRDMKKALIQRRKVNRVFFKSAYGGF